MTTTLRDPRLLLVVALVTVAMLLVPADTISAATLDDGEMLALINASRSVEGLAPLTPHWDLEDDASAQTERQIDAGYIFHTADLTSVVASGWSSIGENVGRGPNMPVLHDAFMASPGHRANILGDYTHVGISAKVDGSSGYTFITVLFMKTSGSTGPAAPITALVPLLPGAIADCAGDTFEQDIEWLAEIGAAFSCSDQGGLYCPSRPVTRGEMASLLARALDLPSSEVDHFTDDDGSPHEADIDAVAAAGITLGCNPPLNDHFCPQNTLTRAQMASFFVRALALPATGVDHFADDTGSVHEANINALAESRITYGCNPPDNTRFCGSGTLTRGQIAAFLHRAAG